MSRTVRPFYWENWHFTIPTVGVPEFIHDSSLQIFLPAIFLPAFQVGKKNGRQKMGRGTPTPILAVGL